MTIINYLFYPPFYLESSTSPPVRKRRFMGSVTGGARKILGTSKPDSGSD